MLLDLEDRRTLDDLSNVIDSALDLAEECGWRYALAFLISEEVPSEIIQRLLSGGARARKTELCSLPTFQTENSDWKGRNTEEMIRLFDSLRARRFAEPCSANQPPASSRASVSQEDAE